MFSEFDYKKAKVIIESLQKTFHSKEKGIFISAHFFENNMEHGINTVPGELSLRGPVGSNSISNLNLIYVAVKENSDDNHPVAMFFMYEKNCILDINGKQYNFKTWRTPLFRLDKFIAELDSK